MSIDKPTRGCNEMVGEIALEIVCVCVGERVRESVYESLCLLSYLRSRLSLSVGPF